MRVYEPQHWYWLASDGRVFSGAMLSLVSPNDEAYKAWTVSNVPTAWPQDEDGVQSNAALQDVLTPHGLIAKFS